MKHEIKDFSALSQKAFQFWEGNLDDVYMEFFNKNNLRKVDKIKCE